jgi:hypothetical protein
MDYERLRIADFCKVVRQRGRKVVNITPECHDAGVIANAETKSLGLSFRSGLQH